MQKIRQKLTANILFAGIGCQERGILDSGLFDLQVLHTSEINKESILSYAAIHNGLTIEMIKSYDAYPTDSEMRKELQEKNIGYNPDRKKIHDWQSRRYNPDTVKKYWLASHLNNNLGDISRIKSLPYADLWTVSFPCQSISCAGRMKGFKPDSGTRSSLLWENIRLLKRAVDDGIPPKYIMFENVKNLVGKKFMNDFLNLLDILGDLGYNSYWKILNAKEFGVPQNRERVFVMCIRKDMDNGTFSFPEPSMYRPDLKDILLPEVDERHYLPEEKTKEFIDRLVKTGTIPDPNTAIGQGIHDAWGVAQRGRYTGSGNIPGSPTEQKFELQKEKGIQNTVTSVQKDCMVLILEGNKETGRGKYRIRRMVPEECAVLMGLSAADFKKCRDVGIGEPALIKQAGNGIVTNCVRLLMEQLYIMR